MACLLLTTCLWEMPAEKGLAGSLYPLMIGRARGDVVPVAAEVDDFSEA
jgi:hypothetical protein